MPTRTVTLTDDAYSFIESGIASGRFSSANDAVAEGVNLLKQQELEHEAKKDWLEAAIQEGLDDLDRGNYVTFDSQRELRDFTRQMWDEAVAQAKHE